MLLYIHISAHCTHSLCLCFAGVLHIRNNAWRAGTCVLCVSHSISFFFPTCKCKTNASVIWVIFFFLYSYGISHIDLFLFVQRLCFFPVSDSNNNNKCIYIYLYMFMYIRTLRILNPSDRKRSLKLRYSSETFLLQALIHILVP